MNQAAVQTVVTATPIGKDGPELAAEAIAQPEAPFRLGPKVWRVVGVVLIGPFMAQMDSTVVNVSLSSIRGALHAPIESAQWIVSGYLLALALTLPLNGWLVDRLGAKKLYLLCFTLFTAASVLCGAATTMEQLIGARVLQGIAGGLMAPLTQLMMARIAGKNMARVMGIAALPVLFAPTVGPLVAGAVLKYAGWPWLFYVNLPIGILAVALAAVVLPSDTQSAQRRPFDFVGFLLISPGLAGALYALEGMSHGGGQPLLLGGCLALLAAFVLHALRKKELALVDLSLFRNKIFATATTTSFFANGIMYAGQFLVPLFLTTGCGLTAADAGWVLMAMGGGMMLVYPFLGFLNDKLGCRTLASAGILLNVVGTLPFLWMAKTGYVPSVTVLCLFLRGMGQGATGIPTISAAYVAVPKERLSFAATALNIVQRLGGPVATTGMAAALALSASYGPATGPEGYFIPFMALTVLQVLVLGTALRLPRRILPR